MDTPQVSPKDHFLLARALARLSLRQALRLLRYCHSLLKMHGVAPVVRLHKLRGARAPSLACVVEWTNALIDAHFSSLVLAKVRCARPPLHCARGLCGRSALRARGRARARRCGRAHRRAPVCRSATRC